MASENMMRSLSYLLAQPRLHRRLDDLRLVEGEAEIPRGLQENASVGKIPYVCPESVMVKPSVSYTNGPKLAFL